MMTSATQFVISTNFYFCIGIAFYILIVAKTSGLDNNWCTFNKVINPKFKQTIHELPTTSRYEHFKMLFECQQETVCLGIQQGLDNNGNIVITQMRSLIFSQSATWSFDKAHLWSIEYKADCQDGNLRCKENFIPSHWTNTSWSCYALSAATTVEKVKAKKMCDDSGLSLASLETLAEYEHVTSVNLEQKIWIDLQKPSTVADVASGWKWGSDGSDLQYDKWAPSEPNNYYQKGEYCARIWHSGIYDEMCTTDSFDDGHSLCELKLSF